MQLPIFLVLYYTIRHFDKLESFKTGGLLWFKDLTVADPLFILPVLYVLTMMASQELAMRNTAAAAEADHALHAHSLRHLSRQVPRGALRLLGDLEPHHLLPELT